MIGMVEKEAPNSILSWTASFPLIFTPFPPQQSRMSAAGGAGMAASKPLKQWVRLSALREIRKVVQPIPHWNIVRGDTVFVLSGKDKGKTGKVKVSHRKGGKVGVGRDLPPAGSSAVCSASLESCGCSQ